MYEVFAMVQTATDEIPSSYNMLAVLIYMLLNETRHRRNGHGNISKSLEDLSNKLSLLALQGAGFIVRLDSHEKRLNESEQTSHDYRKEIRAELRSQADKLSRLEGRFEASQ